MARKRRKTGRPAQQARVFAASGAPLPPIALRLAVPGLIALFSLFAWLARGVHEDGFFFFRVIDVFLRGGGLAYNPGERFETNTEFLWTLMLIPGPAAGLHDILWMQLVGAAVYALALWGTFALARRLIPEAEAALAALVLLGTHYTFTHFAATGFGVVLQALAAVCALLGLLAFGKNAGPRNGAVLGLGLSFLALCRLDSVILGLPVVLCALFFALRAGKSALPGLALALGIPAAVSAVMLAWKLHYYGDILPATYYTKGAASQAGLDLSDFKRRQGVTYLTAYWRRYFLWLLAAVAAFGAWKISRRGRRGELNKDGVRAPLLLTAAGMCVLWHGYMTTTGGGYAEFRFMAAQAPMLMVLLAWGFSGLARHWRAAATAATAAFSLLHWQTAPDPIATGVSRADAMVFTRFSWGENGPRSEIAGGGFQNVHLAGVALAELFAPRGAYPPEVRAASIAGGVVAYHPKIFFTEMHGYADTRISRADPSDLWLLPNEPWVGHQIVARPRWLAQNGVNLVLDAGKAYPGIDFSAPIAGVSNPRLAWALWATYSPSVQGMELPPESQLFALPLADGRFSPVLYFNRNETIDRVLDERGIERVDVF